MPPLSTRIAPISRQDYGEQSYPKAPFDGNASPLSPQGNPAPVRGIFPPEFVYDFSVARFYPDSPTFLRGSIDVNTPIRNLALQAASAAGIKLT